MKPNWRVLLLCASLTSAGATAATAQSVGYIYNYQTPLISVVTGLQVGKRNEIVAVQNSANNVFSVTQVGPVSNAAVLQTGARNHANIVQIGSALPFIWLGP
jgi:hypothetical protein